MINEKIPNGELKTEILKFVQESKTGIIKRYSKNGLDEDQTY
jgi:antitoxin component YwqK of YwqJK toxin-antitoxin module